MSVSDIVHWQNLWSDLKTLFPRMIQPKFVFISVVTLSVSTCGIWIGPLFLKDSSQIGFSIFSFVIATLGVLAAENLLKDDDVSISSLDKYRKQVKISFSVFLWFLAFVFSFYGLKNNINFALLLSFGITLLLWLSITVAKVDFDAPTTPSQTVSNELNNMKDVNEPGAGL
ncbi:MULTISPECIES: hypothetical protein [Aeromonas]|uniref:hypothetical protein n=1 Tax=Aeromonas TaxID=642 RepID=UPI001F5846AA|nr:MULTISPECIES: hypothetical protein [Aeromonas]MDT8956452.1 hypothetical protein [Aeromonas caviae]UNP87544.1 hypothetical protein MNZ22_11945 [Aeromonas encheleia]